MEKGTENINKNVLVHLIKDVADDSEFKLKLKSLDARVQQMLLWSAICSLWSYLILFNVITRIYLAFQGIHVLVLIVIGFLYVLMGVLIYRIWKGIKYKRSYYYFAFKSHLNYQVSELYKQRQLIALYLLTYSSLLLIIGLFFYIDIQPGFKVLLKITTPVNIITYASGLYFVANFTKQIKQLKYLHRQISQLYLKNINSN